MRFPSPPACIGLLLLVTVLTAPFWLNAGEPSPSSPVLAEPKQSPCVADSAWMNRNHMLLLRLWRDEAVRNGARFTVEDGSFSDTAVSLNTCIECHGEREQFCEACHGMHGVATDCWDCHAATPPGDR